MTSILKTARLAGVFYLLQIPLGVFGIIYIPTALLVKGDASTTITNILNNEFMYRLSIVSAILCAVITFVTATYIRKVLQAVNPAIAQLIVTFTVIAAPISILNELNHVVALVLIKSPEVNATFTAPQIKTMLLFCFDLHQYGLQLVNIFFGLWLLPMGYLVIKSGYMPKFIGVLLLLTCVGYLIDFFNFYLWPYNKFVFSQIAWPGEVFMVMWLLIKGVNQKEYEDLLFRNTTSDSA